MADDAADRVLRPGMSMDECRELLGSDGRVGRRLVYEIWGTRAGDACSPVALSFMREVHVFDSGRQYRSTRLGFMPGADCGTGASAWTLSPRQLEAAQLVLRSGGMDRWCANEAGDRLELAEALRDAIEHGWPSDLSFEELEACADHEREVWVFSLYTRGSASTFYAYFEDQVLESVRVSHDY